jgi:DNA polymerase-1
MLEHELHGRVDGEIEYLISAGIYRYEGPKKDPMRKKVRCMDIIQQRVRAAFEGRGEDCPMTEGGKGEVKKPKPKTDAETLERSMDVDLGRLADIMGDKKLLDTYVPVLKQGVLWPINPYYNVLVDSGRTSCSKPNVQNQPRKGGVRESFVPRPGHVYVGCDYHTAELRSLAQYCLEVLGVSEMAKALEHTEKYPHGKDLHLVMASNLLHADYDSVADRLKAGDKAVKNARQISKALNFGYPGGLGPTKFLEFAWASYRMRLAATEYAAIKEAKNLKKLWTEAFPEMRLFFDHISSLSGGADSCTMHLIKSGRVRGDVRYTEACNTVFQSLTADGAKLAVWATVKESWTGYKWDEPIPDDATDISTDSPLLGYRPNGFVHDEIIGESPLPLYRQHAARLADVMKEAMCWFVDRVPVEAEAHVMRRWWKDAEPTYNDKGELIPWSPKNPYKVLAKLQADHPALQEQWGGDQLDTLHTAYPDVDWKGLHRAWMLDELAKERTGEVNVSH